MVAAFSFSWLLAISEPQLQILDVDNVTDYIYTFLTLPVVSVVVEVGTGSTGVTVSGSAIKGFWVLVDSCNDSSK